METAIRRSIASSGLLFVAACSAASLAAGAAALASAAGASAASAAGAAASGGGQRQVAALRIEDRGDHVGALHARSAETGERRLGARSRTSPGEASHSSSAGEVPLAALGP